MCGTHECDNCQCKEEKPLKWEAVLDTVMTLVVLFALIYFGIHILLAYA